MSVKINNLSFAYNKNSDFKISNINFEIKDSPINVLLGLNGCGKTTLVKLLAGLLSPKEGTIEYDEVLLSSMKPHERSKVFSYVSQKQSTTSDFLVRDYLLCGFINSLSFLKSPSEDQIEKMENTAKNMGIFPLLSKKLGEISGGEHQLVSIIAAVLQDTKYIILDEPMSALDITNQEKVLNLLKKIASQGKTIILSSHNPNHALYLDANVYLIKKGLLVDHGKTKDIINVNKLKGIYGDVISFSQDLPYKEISIKPGKEEELWNF